MTQPNNNPLSYNLDTGTFDSQPAPEQPEPIPEPIIDAAKLAEGLKRACSIAGANLSEKAAQMWAKEKKLELDPTLKAFIDEHPEMADKMKQQFNSMASNPEQLFANAAQEHGLDIKPAMRLNCHVHNNKAPSL